MVSTYFAICNDIFHNHSSENTFYGNELNETINAGPSVDGFSDEKDCITELESFRFNSPKNLIVGHLNITPK